MNKYWWKECVVYQIYPRSFKDSNGDGIGDLRGIIEKLDYLVELGIDVLWLSPVYESPNDDNGYDISNYQGIMKEFGTMEDCDLLLAEAHKRKIKIMMDLVINHSSDEHKWFAESKKSKENKYRDYYIWRDEKNGLPPNNWGGSFGGSAWELDDQTQMYYLHLFSKKQPDLNWENKDLRKDIYEMIKWWLEKGVDGFRMDVINMIGKDLRYPDGIVSGPNIYADPGSLSKNHPKVNDYLKEMNREVLSKYDIMTVGETPDVNPAQAIEYVGEDRNELNMVFQFEHMSIGYGVDGKWGKVIFDLKEFKTIMSKWQTQLQGKGWNSLYLNNHDQPRMVSRFGNDGKYRIESAKMLATLLHMMQGTPYIFQGEELGMTNVKFDSLDDYRDIETLNAYRDFTQSGKKTHDEIMDAIYKRGRDNARTPFQWNDKKNAGFTDGTPWIKVNPNYKNINAQAQLHDENSVFNYYKKLIELRKKYEIIVYGDYTLILEDDVDIYAYIRKLADETLLVICNFGENKTKFNLPKNIKYNYKELLITNYIVEDESVDEIALKPYESRVYLLK
ncbi:alpha-glucosidase [Clostridium bowmanii]|uniref:glycoside hydrolase family 13 protein n=1 Tax=Clostridium bowmanii TaxID=132925 RepID=UPI001C0E8421|nr:alpha-glucosidase [Clostridium bowmanii]MBU3190004.1 alpha-glucosidase [Clostridium bowmanii]MCA1074561.1 alpha-glucosidase [Clostridium bowmanii]